MLTIQSRILSSMEKVFPDQEPQALSRSMAAAASPAASPDTSAASSPILTALQVERVSFQIALDPDHLPEHFSSLSVQVEVETDLSVSVSQLGLVPVRLPYFDNRDRRYLRDDPGLFPDPLFPLEKVDDSYTAKLLTGRWNSLFFEVDTKGAAPGTHEISVRLIPTGTYYFYLQILSS